MGDLVEALVDSPMMTVAICVPSVPVGRENMYRLMDLIKAHEHLELDPEGPQSDSSFSLVRPDPAKLQATVEILVLGGSVTGRKYDRVYLDQIEGGGLTAAEREASTQLAGFWVRACVMARLVEGGKVFR